MESRNRKDAGCCAGYKTQNMTFAKVEGGGGGHLIGSKAERGDQNCGQIFITYFPIFSRNSFYSFSVFQNFSKITDI